MNKHVSSFTHKPEAHLKLHIASIYSYTCCLSYYSFSVTLGMKNISLKTTLSYLSLLLLCPMVLRGRYADF